MYTPLYIKTENTLLSSLIKIDDLIKYAKENNYKSLTITDNKMYGAYEFYKNVKKIISNQLLIRTRNKSKYNYSIRKKLPRI